MAVAPGCPRPERGRRWPRYPPRGDRRTRCSIPCRPPTTIAPPPGLRRNRAFMLLWSAATVSVFGVVRDPDRAAVRGDPDPPRRARSRSPSLRGAGSRRGPARRVRRRGVGGPAAAPAGDDLGGPRAGRRCWASIPVAAIGGWLTLPQVFIVSALAAVLTTFFDVADQAYLPTIVGARRTSSGRTAPSPRPLSAWSSWRSASPGSSSTCSRRPSRSRSTRCSFVVSAVLLGAIRRPEPPPPPAADREPILARDPRGHAARRPRPGPARAAVGDDGPGRDVGRVRGDLAAVRRPTSCSLDAAVIGVVAALGGFGSLLGALLAERTAGAVRARARSWSCRCCSRRSATC